MDKDLCAICYDVMKEEEEEIVTTYCKHTFHRKCMKIMFTYNNICPMCKQHQSVDAIILLTGEDIRVNLHNAFTHQYVRITSAMILREEGGNVLPGWPSFPLNEDEERERVNSRYGDEFFPEWYHITHVLEGRQQEWQEKCDRMENVRHRNMRVNLWQEQSLMLGKDISKDRYRDEEQIHQLGVELREMREKKAKEETEKKEKMRLEKWMRGNGQQRLTDWQVRNYVQEELTRIYQEQYENCMKRLQS